MIRFGIRIRSGGTVGLPRYFTTTASIPALQLLGVAVDDYEVPPSRRRNRIVLLSPQCASLFADNLHVEGGVE